MKLLGLEITRSSESPVGFQIKRSTGKKIPFLDWMYGAGSGRASEENALGLPSFWACVSIISESIAMFPVKVIRKTGDVRSEVDHSITPLLNYQTLDNVSAFDYTTRLVASAIIRGNGYAYIERDNGMNPIGMINIHPDYCKPIKYQGQYYYRVEVDERIMMVDTYNMIHIKGFGMDTMYGESIIEYHRKTLTMALGAQDYGHKLYEKGTVIDGYITMDGKLDRDMKESLSEQWQKNYSRYGNRATAILDNGSKYVPLSLSPTDSKFIETTKMQRSEIASLFRVPLPLIGDLENAHYNNVESLNTHFLTYCLGPWIKRIEQEYHNKLLREDQKRDHQIKHTVAALLRSDMKTQSDYFKALSEIGAYGPNDIRRDLDMNPVDGGDVRTIQINRIPIDKIQEHYERNKNTGDNNQRGDA